MVEGTQRRLAAIVSADVVGYSRLMGVDETGTLAVLREHRTELIDPLISEHGGRVVKTMGDGLLLEFPSVVDATQCLIKIQEGMVERNVNIDEGLRITFRVGVNLGDIIIDGDDIHGDGVNIAARLQEISEPGGISISRRVHEDVQDRLDAPFEDTGEQTLKNITRPVQVWRWSPTMQQATSNPASDNDQLSRSDKPSIAVLPFTNLSGDPEQEFFSDGIADDITAELTRFPGLFVIARNSTANYKEQAKNAKQVAEELGVRYVMEGSVRRSGERIRIAVELVDGRTGQQIWSERYDRVLKDIFAVQDEVASSVAGITGARLLASDMERAVRKEPSSLGSYEHVMRSRAHFRLCNKASNCKARQAAEAAIALDPAFAAGHAFLVYALTQANNGGWADDPTTNLVLAREHGLTAVSLDGNDVYSHTALGYVESALGHHDLALAEFERALTLSASGAFIYIGYANALCMANRPQDGLAAIHKGMELDPHYPPMYLIAEGRNFLALGRFEDAVGSFERAVSGLPEYPIGRAYFAAALVALERMDEAKVQIDAIHRLAPGLTISYMRRSALGNGNQATIVDRLRHAGLPE